MAELEKRYREIRARVPSSVRLIAVSKTQPASAIQELYRLGQRDFGENYVQELVEKAADLEARGCTEIRWHFIGHLQTNKVKALVPIVHAIHSIDSTKLGREISKRAEAAGRKLECFLEINIDEEESKSGFAPDVAAVAAKELSALPGLSLRGLMCIPAPRKDAENLRPVFKRMRKIEENCRPYTHGELSMGMSDDFEIAITEGATKVRIGTSIFGAREKS